MSVRTTLLALAAMLCSSTVLGAPVCTSQTRLAGAEQVVYSYNLVAPGESAQAFQKVPFASDCHIFMYVHLSHTERLDKAANTVASTADGTIPLPVAFDGATCYDFAVLSRQVFGRVTGRYDDFAANNTAVIYTTVVYLDYDSNCMIKAVRAYAQVPSELLGIPIAAPDLGIS